RCPIPAERARGHTSPRAQPPEPRGSRRVAGRATSPAHVVSPKAVAPGSPPCEPDLHSDSRQRRGGRRTSVALPRPHDLTRFQVPHLDLLVPAGGGQPAVVGRNGKAEGRAGGGGP